MTDKQRGRRKVLVGRVRSDGMNKTVVVEVPRREMHPVYKKFVSSRRRYAAHDAKNECHVGDQVEIKESRPLSKSKRWVVTRIVERAVTT